MAYEVRFWDEGYKKEPKVDKLSLFLERIAADTSVSVDAPTKWKKRALNAIERTTKLLFEQERRAQQIFERQPPSLSLTSRGGHVTRKGRNHFQLRYFLKRFTNPDAAEVTSGAELPPGAALYRLNPRLSAEQRQLLRSTWSPCIDERGVISPAKIFSWLGPAIAAAVKALSQKDAEKDPDDIPDCEPNFKDVEVIVKFPLIRLVFPSVKIDPDEKEEEEAVDNITIASETTMNSTVASTVNNISYRSLPKSSIREEESVAEEVEEDGVQTRVDVPVESPQKADYGYVNTRLTFWAADAQVIVKSPVVVPPPEVCSQSNVTSVWPETDDDTKNNNKEVEYDEYGLPIDPKSQEAALEQPGLSLDDLNRAQNGKQRGRGDLDGRESDMSKHESLESQSLNLSMDDNEEEEIQDVVETNDDTLENVTQVTETNTYFTSDSNSNRSACLNSLTPNTSKITSRSGLFSAKTETIVESEAENHVDAKIRKKPKPYKPAIPEIPLTIDILPSVRGFGWPKNVTLHLGLPKQKPFCEKGQKYVAKMNKKIEDGYGFWYMDLHSTPDIPNASAYKDMLLKLGNPNRMWTYSLHPAEHLILKNVKKICLESETDIEPVFKILQIILNYENWDVLSSDILNSVVLKVVRKTVISKPDLKEMCFAVIKTLQKVAASQKCPSILQANINIATGISPEEGKRIAEEIGFLLEKMKRDPSYVLRYIGYPTKEEKRLKELDTLPR